MKVNEFKVSELVKFLLRIEPHSGNSEIDLINTQSIFTLFHLSIMTLRHHDDLIRNNLIDFRLR